VNTQERNELAADIARRVRLYCEQSLDPEFVKLLGPGCMTRIDLSVLRDFDNENARYLAVELTTDGGRNLLATFYDASGGVVQRIRFANPDDRT